MENLVYYDDSYYCCMFSKVFCQANVQTSKCTDTENLLQTNLRLNYNEEECNSTYSPFRSFCSRNGATVFRGLERENTLNSMVYLKIINFYPPKNRWRCNECNFVES